MAKQLLNKQSNKTIIFSDNFENELRNLNNCNCHDEIRVEIAKHLGLNTFAEKFNKFVYLPWKTAEQMAERYEITKQFLEIIKFLYGIKATRYISQFL